MKATIIVLNMLLYILYLDFSRPRLAASSIHAPKAIASSMCMHDESISMLINVAAELVCVDLCHAVCEQKFTPQ